jgi:hypothetical protein
VRLKDISAVRTFKLFSPGCRIGSGPIVAIATGSKALPPPKEPDMTTQTFSPSTSTTPAAATSSVQTAGRTVLWRGALGYGVVAAVATSVIAAAADVVGNAPSIEGEAIPPLGFAQLTFMGALLGLALAAGLRRWSARPQHRFIVTTIVLTVLSWVPDLLVDASPASRAVLMTTHLVAALIIVPAIARRLPKHATNRS